MVEVKIKIYKDLIEEVKVEENTDNQTESEEINTIMRPRYLDRKSGDFVISCVCFDHADVGNGVCNKEYYVDKTKVIEKSDVLSAMTSQKWKEGQSNKIVLEGVNCGVLEAFISCCMTGRVS